MRLRYILPPILWACVISALSQLSNPPGRPSLPAASYGAHFVEFFVLGLLMARAVRGRRGASAPLMIWALAAGVTMLFGIADELHQAFVPGRDPSVLDWLVDAAGAVAGVAFWALPGRTRAGGGRDSGGGISRRPE